MGRWACVDVPALPLQLLLQRRRDWADQPAGVVAEDHPQARLLWLNERARERGILPGMRYAAALALSRELRVDVIDQAEISRGVARLTAALRRCSPEVEPCAESPGVFWLDGDGLDRLFASASAWARRLHAAVVELGFRGRVVVGFTRYGTYAAAAAPLPDRGPAGGGRPEVVVFRDPAEEQAAARDVPLDRLTLEPEVRDDLQKLGVRTLGEFLDLPAGGVHERFGEEASRTQEAASGAAWTPLQPARDSARFIEHFDLGYPDADRARLLVYIEQLLAPLLERLAARGEVVRALRVGLLLETRAMVEQVVQPAAPTREGAQLVDLVNLWLESVVLPAKVEEIELEAMGAPLVVEQRNLWAEEPRRDPEAAGRALARLRAEFGPAAVVRARLADGHLPEAAFLWAPLEEGTGGGAAEGTGTPSRPSSTGEARCLSPAVPLPPPTLIRRIYSRPVALPPRPHHLRDDGWLIRGPGHGAVVKFIGPYVVSGGWWVRPQHREYHFAQTQRGDVLWVYFDRENRRWRLQGRVE